jgi:hypothetical protein
LWREANIALDGWRNTKIALDGWRDANIAFDGWRKAWILRLTAARCLDFVPDGGAMLQFCA